jgi:hypothetical protein
MAIRGVDESPNKDGTAPDGLGEKALDDKAVLQSSSSLQQIVEKVSAAATSAVSTGHPAPEDEESDAKIFERMIEDVVAETEPEAKVGAGVKRAREDEPELKNLKRKTKKYATDTAARKSIEEITTTPQGRKRPVCSIKSQVSVAEIIVAQQREATPPRSSSPAVSNQDSPTGNVRGSHHAAFNELLTSIATSHGPVINDTPTVTTFKPFIYEKPSPPPPTKWNPIPDHSSLVEHGIPLAQYVSYADEPEEVKPARKRRESKPKPAENRKLNKATGKNSTIVQLSEFATKLTPAQLEARKAAKLASTIEKAVKAAQKQ